MPRHIAIIMDGNGRWARMRGLTRNFGHKQGVSALQRVAKYCSSIGIEYLTVYAFSTENWKRPKQEIDSLLDLMREYIVTAKERFGKDNMKLKIIGDMARIPEDLKQMVLQSEKDTAENTGMTLVIAWNYGGRDEIVNAAKNIAADARKGILKADDINEEYISGRLYTCNIPDPDILVRTSGEQRTSNFLIWQAAYSELYFTPVLWPDMKEKDIDEVIKAYTNRERRYGGITN